MNSNKFVFISGATSGIGLATAKNLLDAGYHVLAGCFPDIQAGEALKSYAPDRVTLVSIDVVDGESVATAVEFVTNKVAGQGLAGLVNSAGIVLLSPTEHTSIDEFQRVLNINLVGTFAVTKMMLPLLRQAKGTVVNVSSDGGILSMPTGAAYCASKFGVEAFSDVLRGEVCSQGVKVAIIEPGNIDTPLWETLHPPLQAKYDALEDEQQNLYGKMFRGLLGIQRQGIAVERVAETICRALVAKSPKARYRVGKDAHVSKLISLLPARWRDRLSLKVIESYAKG